MKIFLVVMRRGFGLEIRGRLSGDLGEFRLRGELWEWGGGVSSIEGLGRLVGFLLFFFLEG